MRKTVMIMVNNNYNSSRHHLGSNNNPYILVGDGCHNYGNNLSSYFNTSNLNSNITTSSG